VVASAHTFIEVGSMVAVVVLVAEETVAFVLSCAQGGWMRLQ
jgi:hypothetical protein